MRYTECRLTPLAEELLKDMGSPSDEIVRWGCNFDDTLKEPEILPGRFPNLLVNGASGIAVGLATNIPTHNLGETIDAAIAYIDKPKIKLDELLKIMKGPDFPTGGYIIADEELVRAYETGKGKLIVRAKVHFEAEGDKPLIVIDELPYQVNKSALLESILKLREDKKEEDKKSKQDKGDKKGKKDKSGEVLKDIVDIADESDRNGIRAVIRCRKDSDPSKILEILFKSTNLSTSFGVNMVAIAGGKPQTMGLIPILEYYVNYQREFIVKRTKCELENCKKREHILEGLVIAVKNIDEVVKIIKMSKNTGDARDRLRERFKLSVVQADAILDLRLARLTSLEVYKLEEELKELKKKIAELTAILGSKKLQMEVVKNEMLEIKRKYKTPRKTTILKSEKDYKIADASAPKVAEECVVCYNANGNLKRMLVKNFTMAKRDFNDNSSKNEICSSIILCPEGVERILCFTSKGNCHKIDVDQIHEGKWKEKGAPLKSVVPSATADEKIIYMLPLTEKLPKGNVLFYTKEGMVKKTEWSEYIVAKTTFEAIKLHDGDEVIGIEPEKKEHTLMFVTAGGMYLNADMSDIPLQKRIAGGVKGINLNDGDECVYIGQVHDGGEVVFVSDKGQAMRALVCDMKIMARYRKGNKGMTFKGDGKVVFASYVTEPYQIVLSISEGFLSAFSTEDLQIIELPHTGKPLVRKIGKNSVEEVLIYNDDYVNGRG